MIVCTAFSWTWLGFHRHHNEGIVWLSLSLTLLHHCHRVSSTDASWTVLWRLVIYTHTHPFNSPFSGTTQVSRYQKGKQIWIILEQETVSGSGISWVICKSAPCSGQTTMPAPHHSAFYRPDALPVAQPTESKHWRHEISLLVISFL